MFYIHVYIPTSILHTYKYIYISTSVIYRHIYKPYIPICIQCILVGIYIYHWAYSIYIHEITSMIYIQTIAFGVSFLHFNRWSSSLGLFSHVLLKRDQGDWDRRLRLNVTPNATGRTCIYTNEYTLYKYIYINEYNLYTYIYTNKYTLYTYVHTNEHNPYTYIYTNIYTYQRVYSIYIYMCQRVYSI